MTFIMDEVAKVVSPYKKVRLVEFIDAIPKQPSGKLLRRVLKARVGKFGSSDELLSLPKTAVFGGVTFFENTFFHISYVSNSKCAE